MMVMDGVEMVDVHEAARLVRRTPETIRRWVWSGRLPATKQGQKLFIPRRALLAESTAEELEPNRPTLRQWATEVARSRQAPTQVTARELVLDDRASR